jgi:anti-sigma B factor antagonist
MNSTLNVYVTELGPAANALTVSLIGQADIASAPVLRGQLLRLLNRVQRPLVLDLTELEFIDSTGLGALIAGYQRAKLLGCPLCFAAPTHEVSKLLNLTALETIIQIYPSVGDACRHHLGLEPAPPDRAPVPIETYLMNRPPVTSDLGRAPAARPEATAGP